MPSASIVALRLSRLAPLGPEATAALCGLRESHRLPAGGAVVEEMEPLRPRFLVSGWAARVRWLADGRRQVIGLVLPGDGVGICERPQPLALCAMTAVTPVELVDASTVARQVFGPDGPQARDLSVALAMSAAMDEAHLIDHIVRLGRQTAIERMAHLLLELRFRLALVDLAQDDEMPLPLTQEQLADALGLSAVHVNRTLQQLRREGLIELGQGRVRLLRRPLLETIADYKAPEVTRWGGGVAAAS
ncbi:Crp/Fnr family transcriptional regulator [Brevundimonas sp. Root1279]|uniref:Crp/Fnr family transcriptional regulator n=1 Tax=Brevundimonas sp. Root1279 TaxID=1736443 RepID=UPI0006F7E977|nr:Crp/Fnr family transcriptional regulator [Brevundimonas sp. Root1279]KQW80782.1 hypothetical protein ASC65_12460 [Brevundimonas sp. Root1279]